jgi:hypothetical protein
MKKLSMLGTISGAALLTVAPFSLQWSQDEASLSLNSATSIAGVHRRVYRTTYRRAAYPAAYHGFRCHLPSYVNPPPADSYYLPPFASVNSYDYRCGR